MFSNLSPQSRITEVNSVSVKLGLTYTKKALESGTYLAGLFSYLDDKSDLLGVAINRSKAESNLDDKDVVRDEKVQALYYLLLGAIYNPNTEISASANKLYTIFTKYGLKIIKESYLIESSLIESMLEDYADLSLQADIAAVLGSAELIASLQTAQNDFRTADTIWDEEKAKEDLTQSASEIKKEVLTIINGKILVYLKAMSQVNPEVYAELAKAVSDIIEEVNQAVKRRSNGLARG
jgi:hypothetical protein